MNHTPPHNPNPNPNNQDANTPPQQPIQQHQEPLIDMPLWNQSPPQNQPNYQPRNQNFHQNNQPKNNAFQVQQQVHYPNPPNYQHPPMYQNPMYPQQQPPYNQYPKYQPYPPPIYNPQQYPYPPYQQPPNYMQQYPNQPFPPNPPQELTVRQMMETDVTHTPLVKPNFNKRPRTPSPTFKHKLETWPSLSIRWNKGVNFHLNPKNPNVSAITLRSGKTLGERNPKRVSREEEDEVIIFEPSKVVAPLKEPVVPNVDQRDSSNKNVKPLVIPPPFPSRLASSKKKEDDKEFLETFRKVQMNISLLDAIKQIPRYAKFLKDLCTNKRTFKANKKIQVNENVSAVIQKKLPPKCKDLGMFAIPFTIGDLHVESAMLDLGASINVMPYSSDSSISRKVKCISKGHVGRFTSEVNQLVFPADFCVIDLEEKNPSKSSMILLGRPFMNTAHTIIDVHNGKITMEFDGETIHFNIFEAMRYPRNISPLYRVDMIEPITQQLFELSYGDILKMVLNLSLDCESL
ncbi:MADS-box MEF2 type transcription factor MIG1-like [Lactuca sativa]|uniref:MADS-box MEF2 type transcription factor MIG1-like n=1 Tax=Lactuca sativa TaxID=4236 RepID=UPI0022AF5A5B|nr:MADS-box MEF2 type transcription factor MIG1-like [Lactuca sativa]